MWGCSEIQGIGSTIICSGGSRENGRRRNEMRCDDRSQKPITLNNRTVKHVTV